jgi:hypothetical protein
MIGVGAMLRALRAAELICKAKIDVTVTSRANPAVSKMKLIVYP